MIHSLAALATLALLWLSAAIARYVRPRLPETHRTRETIETMQLMIGMLVTFAALVLGLLTASVKNSYDSAGRDRQGYALQLTQLDRCLRDYGSAADPIRELLKSYTAAVIASTWPNEPRPAGVHYPDTSRMPLVGADPELAGIMDQAGVQLRPRPRRRSTTSSPPTACRFTTTCSRPGRRSSRTSAGACPGRSTASSCSG